MSFKFNEENEEKFQELLTRYPDKKALSLPILWLTQYQEGYISNEALIYLADRIGKSPMEMYSIASFYSMFKLKPTGKYNLQICKTLSCMLNGSEEILAHAKEKLGIQNAQTTKDGMFTITEVECLGNCGNAPCMSLNDDYIDNLSIDKLDKIIEDLKK